MDGRALWAGATPIVCREFRCVPGWSYGLWREVVSLLFARSREGLSGCLQAWIQDRESGSLLT